MAADDRDHLDEAVKESALAVLQEPQNAGFHTKYGTVLGSAGHRPEAVVEFQKAVAIKPTDRNAQLWLREALCAEGKFDDAAAAWRGAINADPVNHDTWYGYAEFCLYIGRIDDYRWARSALLQRFERSNIHTVLERTSRTCLLTPDISTDELARATAAIDRAVGALSPQETGFRPYALFAKGLAEYRNGHPQVAIDLEEGPAASVLGPAPNLVSAMAHFKLGETSAARNRLTTAIASYDWTPTTAMTLEGCIYHILRREAEKEIRAANHGGH